MTLYRVVHDKNNPYLTINTTIAEDTRLSWKAKGVWFYAFSRKDDWNFYFKDILTRSTEGRDSLRSALKELEDSGYLLREKLHDEKGKFSGHSWIFFETSKSEEELKKLYRKPGKPSAGKTVRRENRPPGNHPLTSNKYITNKKEEEESQLADARFRLSTFLFEKILAIDPKAKSPNFKNWSRDMDKLIRLDERTEQEIESVITWVFNDDFWCQNILSPKKLRQKFNQLYINMVKKKVSPQKKKEDLATKNYETIKQNREWVIRFLENIRLYDRDNFKVQDFGVEVKYLGGFNTLGYLENGFREQVKSYSLKMLE